MNKESFGISKLFKDSLKTLFQPKAYFTGMETSGGVGEPVIKALIYGIIAGIFILIWSFLDVIGITTGAFSGNVGVVGFFTTIIGAVIGVFIAGLIIMILSYICSGNRNYEANLRAAASIMVILPVSAILGFFGGISYELGAIITLLVHLYGVYMLFNALTFTLKGSKNPAKAISVIVGVILIIFTIISLSSEDKVKDYTGLNLQKTEAVDKEYNMKKEKQPFSGLT